MDEITGKIDDLTQILVKESTLTLKQLKVLMLYYENLDKRIVKKGYVEFEGKNVSKGVFFNTLNQAKNNIRRAVITLILLSYLGLIDANQIDVIMQLSEIMMQFKNSVEKIPEEAIEAFLKRLKTVIDLRKRKK
ncbi:MAG: hypothetical protein ACUVQ0_02200 [Thermoproteota archaeon]